MSSAAYYLIFFIAGMPALVYQVAWQRLLTLYFGVDIYSTAITVSTFMLGLGVGSLIGGRLADRIKSPAIAYAGVEAAMGLLGLASVPVFSLVGQSLAGSSLAAVIAVDFALLLLPTTLMGVTLPLMCRIIVTNDESIGRHLSWLYGVNTFGAATGALLTSFLLLGLLGLDGATYLAAALNVVLAAVVVALSRRAGSRGAAAVVAATAGPVAASRDEAARYRWTLVLAFVSGFIALGYELVWYRILGLVLHGTVYAFGTILFFYLAGMALGSLAAKSRIDTGHCVERFALCQLGIAAYSLVLFTILARFSDRWPLQQLIAASFFTSFHPSPELVSGHADLYSIYSLLDIAFWPTIILGVPTFLMGYGFTNLIRSGAQRAATVGGAVGGLYCANIVGSTIGSLAVGFIMLDRLGTESTLAILTVMGGLITPLALAVGLISPRSAGGAFASPMRIAAVAAVLLLGIFAFPGRTTILRALHFANDPRVDFVAYEDRTGVSALRRQHAVLAFEQELPIVGQQRLYIDGSHHGEASEPAATDWGVRVALAAHPAPRRVLSIGLGDGLMAATAVESDDVHELVIIELNGTLHQTLRATVHGEKILSSPKTTYIQDDGRRWLSANADERFDLIMMFPLHAAHAFSGNLFSIEFLHILARHLEEGGVVVLRSVDAFSTAKTVATAFPYVFRLDNSLYVASGKPIRLQSGRLPDHADVVSPRITADRDTILAHTGDAKINTDLRPNSEFYITYPYVQSLQTRFRDPHAYQADDRRFVQALLPSSGEDQ